MTVGLAQAQRDVQVRKTVTTKTVVEQRETIRQAPATRDTCTWSRPPQASAQSIATIERLALNSGSSGVRESAVASLGQFDDFSAAQSIERIALNSGSSGVRRAAVIALSQNHNPRNVAIIEGIALNSGSSSVREAAVLSLGRIGAPEAAAAIENIAEHSGSSSVRSAAVRALAGVISELR